MGTVDRERPGSPPPVDTRLARERAGLEPKPRSSMRNHTKQLVNVLIGATAVLFVGTRLTSEHDANGPVLTAAVSMVNAGLAKDSVKIETAPAGLAAKVTVALGAFASVKPNLSHPQALEN